MTLFWCWETESEEANGFCVKANGAEEAATEAAEYDFHNRDGWERREHTTTWHVRAEGGLRVEAVDVLREYDPTFLYTDAKTLKDRSPPTYCCCGHLAPYHDRDGCKCRWFSCECEAFKAKPGFPSKPVNK